MCEANAYLKTEEGETLIMESVDQVIPLPEEVILQDIFGSKKTMKAKISHLVLLDHKIVLESIT